MREDLELLGDCVASWRQPLNRERVFERLTALDLFKHGAVRLQKVEALQREANTLLRAVCESSDVFSDFVNDRIGNVLLIRVSPDAFRGTCFTEM
jgi:hypothetical protein